MNEESSPSPAWRWFRRTVLVFGILFMLVVGGGIFYFKSLPMPRPEVFTAAEQRYRSVRALFPTSTEIIPAPSTKTVPVALSAKPTTETLQARCDALFGEILKLKYDNSAGDLYVNFTRADLDNARALAELYDRGVRVSKEARKSYRLISTGQAIITLANALTMNIDDPRQLSRTLGYPQASLTLSNPSERTERFDRYIQSLKFMRAVDCPVPRLYYSAEPVPFREYLLKDSPPPELMNFDIELLAPRGPMDWDQTLAVELDYLRDQRLNDEKLLHMGNAFQFFKTITNNDGRPKTWYTPVVSNLAGVGGAIIGPPKFFAPRVESDLHLEQSIQNYATALKANNLTPQIVSGAAILEFHNGQIGSRVVAGAIELRRGAPVPSPDKIGPDSYFFDPITQQPYMFQVETESSSGMVTLKILRPTLKTQTDPGVKPQTGRPVYFVRLPANHPGLK